MPQQNLTPFRVAQIKVQETAAALEAAGIHSPQVNARALVALAAGHDGSLLLINKLPADFEQRLAEFVERRLNHEPLQQIQGFAPFRRLQLKTVKGVFIPRPETEVAIDEVHAFLAQEENSKWLQAERINVIDACTGSGTLAAACLDEIPNSYLTAFDMNPKAVQLAKQNLLLAAGYSSKFQVFEAALPSYLPKYGESENLPLAELENFKTQHQLPQKVEIFLANPPYIPAAAVPKDREVLEYDPPESLFGGGDDGLGVPRAVILLAATCLKPGGLFLMEHADVQGEETRQLAQQTGAFGHIETVQDLTGKDRFLKAIKI